ncbi:ABC transporter permease [Tessaracoccus palaemonis]|uniref:ABC transporter permease n=1 Tax=Tessaracoccus palaemonis TaxID=2829499 RepID=A0ABX8SJE7_9ACTN|nr:ABC transporter permease [Tessaracoccus palaemonis]QXT62098.1 ABC transporter permease [Tessaracoccus palaemonis]
MTTTMRRRVGAGLWSAYPARTRPGTGRWVPATVAAALLLAIWWAVTAGGLVAPLYLPGPEDVAARMVSQLSSGVAWRYLTPTISAALLGALIAVAVAIPVGILIAHSRPLAAVLEPFVALSQTVPLVAIAPLLVLWLGYGTVPIAVLCAIVAFFPMITTTVVGLRSLDMRVVETALLDGASFPQRLWHIEGPMVAPAVLAGVRGGMALAMTGAVVGEMVMGGSGMGTLLTISRQTADTASVFAVVAWIALVAMALYGIVSIAERAAVRRLQGVTT